jgi:hypothetical protein
MELSNNRSFELQSSFQTAEASSFNGAFKQQKLRASMELSNSKKLSTFIVLFHPQP